MKVIFATAAALILLAGSPAMAMSCCGGGKGKAMMCSKGGTAMSHAGMTGKKSGCCCDGMGMNMSRKRS